jgi:sulfatase modifying factor 1
VIARVCGLAVGLAGMVGAAACSSRTPVGGLVVLMELDPGLSAADISGLHVGVRSPGDGGKVYRNLTYPVAQDAGPSHDGGDGVSFPATLAIESSGDSASVVIDLEVWAGSKPIDLREYEVLDIPTDHFVELVVIFGGPCAAQTTLLGGQAVSLCDPGQTCSLCLSGPSCNEATNGKCALDVIPASSLPPYSADAGALPALADAGVDATLDDAATFDAMAMVEEPPGEGFLDAATEASDASEAGDAGDDAPSIVVPTQVPCDPACTEGTTHCVDGACVPVPPSCAGNDLGVGYNCGGAFGTDDCCASYDVGGGKFYRDYDSVTHNDKSAPATVSAFALDVYEVTVGRFRKFVTAASGTDAAAPWLPAPDAGKHVELNDGGGLVNGGGGAPVFETGWQESWNAYLPTTKAGWDASLLSTSCSGDAAPPTNTWRPAATASLENFPIDCVSWYQAYAFCIWDGGFLPSSTEWNRAAAPPDPTTGQRVYAWGSNPPLPDCKLAIWGDYYGGGSFSSNGVAMGLINIGPVGTPSAGRSLWGQLDLTGNVWEWTLDYWTGVSLDPCVDCADTAAGTQRIFRGGSFTVSDLRLLNNSYVGYSPPEVGHGDVGFRCARAP